MLLALAVFSWPAPNAFAAAPTVTASRPRLLTSVSDLAALKSLTTCDSVGASLSTRLTGKADGLISQPAVAYNSARPQDLYGSSQTVLDRSVTLSMAWQVTGNTAYADRLWTELNAVTSYPDWSSNGNFLGTASLAEAVAIGYDSGFDHWTASQKGTLRQAIVDKGLRPSITLYEQNVGWESQRGNFNIVSNTGVIMAALAVEDTDATTSDTALQYALASLQNGVSGYAPDGGYREGPQYWGYATMALVTVARALQFSTGSDQGIFASPGVAATGDAALDLTGPSGDSFSYGDSKGQTINTKPRPSDSPALLALGAQYHEPELIKAGVDAAQSTSFNQWGMLWYRCGQASSTPSQAGLPLDSYYRYSQVATMRSGWDQLRANYLGFKAATVVGNSHPQLDAGTFVLDALGVNWATELGPDDYSLPGYQDGQPKSQRWTYYRQRAEGNNTLVLDPGRGPDQDTTVDSSITTVASNPSTALAVADLTPSVRAVATSWRRGVTMFDNRQQMVVQDEVTGKKAVDTWWGMHTDAKITIAADGRSAVLTKQGQQLLARITSPSTAVFTQQAAQALWTGLNPDGQADSSGIRKLTIHVGSVTQSTVAVQFSPVRAGVATPATAAVVPLSAWNAPSTSAATLSSLAVNGKAIAGFQPGTLTYDAAVAMPAGIPAVSATVPAGTQVSVRQPTSLPGVATVTASASGLASSTYTVYVGKGMVTTTYGKASSGSAATTTDGDETTRWLAAGNQSLQYNFAAAEKVSKVRIKWSPASASTSKYGVIVSDDGRTWRTVTSGTVLAAGGWVSASFPAVTTRYVGMMIDSQGVSTRYVGVNEIEFYNDPDVTATATTQTQPATVKLSSFASALRVKDTFTPTVTVTDAAGASVSASTYTSNFVSSDPSVVSVSSTGQFTAKAPGQAMVGAVVTSAARTVAYQSVLVSVTDPWTTKLTPSADAYVSSVPAETGKNFGTGSGLLVKKVTAYSTTNRESYLAFNLAAYKGKSVVSAKLVYAAVVTDSGGTSTTVDLHAVSGSWSEGSVTYATKPALGARLGGSQVTSEVATSQIDVTSYVRSQVAANANANLGFYQDNPTNGKGLLVYLYSRESTRQPYLQIETSYVAP